MRSSEGDTKTQSSSTGKDKFIPSGVGRNQSGSSGTTGSSRSYPKGGGAGAKADFNPMKCGKSDYAVGGV